MTKQEEINKVIWEFDTQIDRLIREHNEGDMIDSDCVIKLKELNKEKEHKVYEIIKGDK